MSLESKPKVSIFIGSGGVGKTTLSSLYAISLEGRRSLITIDPSKRLKDLFKKPDLINDMTVSLNDRTDLFHDFLDKSIEDKELLKRFKENSLFKSLMNNLSVSQEFTSFYELVKNFEDEKINNLILDTPPLQNSADFFNGAELLEKLFSSRLISFFIPDEDRGLISKVFNRGREIALSSLSKLTGSEFMKELSEFFEVSQKVRVPIVDVLKEAKRIILEESELFFVTSYEELSLIRVRSSLKDLLSKGLNIKTCYVNRYYITDDEYEKRLDTVLESLVKDFPSIKFEKVEMAEEEPSSLEKLKKWSTSVFI